MTAMLGVDQSDGPECTCRRIPHRATCMTVAHTQPHAMVNDDGEVFYPDNRGDAWHFTEYYKARPLRPDVFPYDLGGGT